MTARAGRTLPGPQWRVVRQGVQRLSWGVADQAVGALTNFLLAIYIARTLGAAEFGSFSIAYVTYGFVNNISRGLAIEPLLTRFSGTERLPWRRAVKGATGTALLVGLVTGVCAALIGVLLGGSTGRAFLALALVLPGLMLQDSWRYTLFAERRGQHAFLNDVIWALVQIPLLVLLRATGHADTFTCVLAWGAGALVGAVVGAWQSHVLPSLRQTGDWLRQHRDVGPRYLLENTGNNASDTFRGYSVSGILGLEAVGYMQAAGTLLGPFRIVFFGLGLMLTPETVRVAQRSPRRLPLFCAAASAGLAVLALAWSVTLLVALPRGLGELILGDLWRPTYPLVLPTAIGVLSSCISLGAVQGLHALSAARRSLRGVLMSSAVILTSTVVGALLGDVVTSMYCFAVASWFGTLLIWMQFRKAMHESALAPLPAWLLPPRMPAPQGAASGAGTV